MDNTTESPLKVGWELFVGFSSIAAVVLLLFIGVVGSWTMALSGIVLCIAGVVHLVSAGSLANLKWWQRRGVNEARMIRGLPTYTFGDGEDDIMFTYWASAVVFSCAFVVFAYSLVCFYVALFHINVQVTMGQVAQWLETTFGQ